ncbi:Hypothetical predicted protein, partial [Paramuricea clavata]
MKSIFILALTFAFMVFYAHGRYPPPGIESIAIELSGVANPTIDLSAMRKKKSILLQHIRMFCFFAHSHCDKLIVFTVNEHENLHILFSKTTVYVRLCNHLGGAMFANVRSRHCLNKNASLINALPTELHVDELTCLMIAMLGFVIQRSNQLSYRGQLLSCNQRPIGKRNDRLIFGLMNLVVAATLGTTNTMISCLTANARLLGVLVLLIHLICFKVCDASAFATQIDVVMFQPRRSLLVVQIATEENNY